MSKLVVQLKGGLGNQMFQYAAARSISLQNNLELVIDDWSGFYRDFQYKRKFELNVFPIKGSIANFFEIIPFLYASLCVKFKRKFTLINKFAFGNFIQEQSNLNDNSMSYQSELEKINLNKNTWIKGYWQSYLYFEKYKNLIRAELTPPPPMQKKFKLIAKEILNSDSVALGLRVYEESNDPTSHALLNKIQKNIFEINKVINKFRKNFPNFRFFVFSTRRFNFLKQINLPNDTVFITHDNGFKGTAERMWLLSQCKHHIFNNSSFYWWGAWLSSKNYQADEQIIYAANNFININGLLKEWKKF